MSKKVTDFIDELLAEINTNAVKAETSDKEEKPVESPSKQIENVTKIKSEDPSSAEFDALQALYAEAPCEANQVETLPKVKTPAIKVETEDPSSEQFDPLQALYAENLRVTKKPPPIKYQNLAAFDTALKKYGVWGLQQKQNKAGTVLPSTSKQTTEATASTRRFLPHQMPIKATADSGFKQRHNKNLLKWLEKVEGPLKILADAMQTKRQVRVVVRNEHGVRGYMHGIVISFDRHWNLLLKDVIEVWCRRKFKYGVNKHCEADNPSQDCTAVLEELGITLPTVTVRSLNRKNVEVTRKLEQLFIRGEQVVLVNIVDINKT